MSARRAPDTGTIGGRLKSERQRLGMSQAAFATVAGASRRAMMNWKSNGASPLLTALNAWADAGADALYIATGRRETVSPAPAHGLPGVTVRQALAMLDPADRHRLLLDLLADELRG